MVRSRSLLLLAVASGLLSACGGGGGGSSAKTSITNQPQSVKVAAGEHATFKVEAKGKNLTYQWMKGGVAISGATSDAYTIAAVSASDADQYTVKVTGAGGNVTSDAATLTLGSSSAPSIGTQPVSVLASNNGSASFAVTAYGSAPLSYQWYKDGAPISGARSRTYAIAKVSASSVGLYYVVVTNPQGNVQSATASLMLKTDPMITAQPQEYFTGIDTYYEVKFSVTAVGSGTLTYQWYKDGVKIPGQVSSTLSFTGVTADDFGNYFVNVTGSAGTTRSASAPLTLVEPPVIVTQPQSMTKHVGESVTFTVKATGHGPLLYFWLKLINGVYVGPQNGPYASPNPDFTIPSVTAADATAYQVYVISPTTGQINGPLTVSADATLTVIP